MNKRYKRKAFWLTLFWKQNWWHTSGVIGHTLKVTWCLIRKNRWDLVPAGLLHDFGKPYSAYQKPKDVIRNEYSFTNHEEFSWFIIKNWKISQKTKDIVRYHYLLRGMYKAKKKGQFSKYNRQRKIWDKLSPEFQEVLREFQICDDIGKKNWVSND